MHWRRSVYKYNVGVAKKGRRSSLYFGLTLMVVLPAIYFTTLSGRAVAHANPAAIASVKLIQVEQAPKLQLAPLPKLTDGGQASSIIANFVQAHPQTTWSVAVQGLGTDIFNASYNPNQVFNSASIFKLLLVYPLSQKLPISQWATTNLNVNGTSRSLQDCVTAMLRISDNNCAVAVGDWLRWGYADVKLHAIGLSNTTLNKASGPVTTAADTAKYLAQLWSGNLVDDQTKAFILSALSQQTLRGGIPAGCPGCQVADKTGDLGSVRHDIGIITSRGKSYILSIFTSGASYSLIAQLTAQIQAVVANN